ESEEKADLDLLLDAHSMSGPTESDDSYESKVKPKRDPV
nr:hypothetical protein [Tanacetum cinerariifolium]